MMKHNFEKFLTIYVLLPHSACSNTTRSHCNIVIVMPWPLSSICSFTCGIYFLALTATCPWYYRNSCSRGWRLLTLLCCWFVCSDILKPFLLTYLQQNAADPSRTYYTIASTCLLALRKTLKHGGRRNVPTSDEITAIMVNNLLN